GAAAPTDDHDDLRSIPGADARLGRRDATHCCDASGDRSMYASFRAEDVAVDAGASAEIHGRGGQQTISRTAAGSDVPASRRAVLAACVAAPDSGCAG